MTEIQKMLADRALMARVLGLLLLVVFVCEALVMFLLDAFWPADAADELTALVDATLLATFSAPLIWLILLRPLQRAYAGETDRALASARYASEKFRTLFDNANDAIFIHDLQGRILEVNRTACDRLGYSREELLGKTPIDLDSPEYAARVPERLAELRRRGHIVFESEHVHRDGTRIAVEINARLVEFDAAPAVLSVSRDITQRKRDDAERQSLQAIDTLLHESDQRVLRGETSIDLLRFICAEAVRLFDLQLAWVGRKEADGQVSILACGGDCGYVDSLLEIGVRWDETPLGRGPAGMAIRTARPQILRSNDRGFQPWSEAARQQGLRAIIAFPLVTRGAIYGTFVLYSRQADGFDDPVKVQRLAEIAGRISVVLDMAADQQQLRLLSTALTAAGNAVFLTDRMGHILWANPAFERLTGYTVAEAVGQNPRFLKSGRQDSDYYRRLWKTLLEGNVWSEETVERHKNGTLYTVIQTITPIRDSAGEITHFVSIHEDITAQKLNEERIRQLAHFDALTNLPNRALFYDRLYQAVALSRRDGRRLGLLFIDLDRFKAVNDELGHAAGDRLLQTVATRLRECVRESDTVARLAGDEFTVILSHIESAADAAAVAEKILAALAAPFRLENRDVSCGASIGIALCPDDAGDVDTLVKCADAAMYAAKTEGRNTYRHFIAGEAGLSKVSA